MAETPSQKFVPIKEIRDGIVVLNSGEMRSVIMATPINLGLKSADEQQATIMQFQNFLNSLEFSVQLQTSSRRLDIRPYLLSLEKRLEEIPEELLRIQTREYIEFIRSFNEQYNVMMKYFYVVVAFSGGGITPAAQTGFLSKLGKKKDANDTTTDEMQKFEESRSQLEQRIAVVTSGLTAMGITSRQLETPELVELYQGTFNPGELHSAAGALQK
jgi:type IV secretory pathway VirB4 component